MKTKILAVFFGLLLGMGVYSQQRLAASGDPNVAAGRGQAEIVINAANADRDIVVWINSVIVAHLLPKSSEKIIVTNGANLIEAADTQLSRGSWSIGTKKQITVNSNSDRVTIGCTTRYGALLNLTLQGTMPLGGAVAAAPPVSAGGAPPQPTRPASPPPPAASTGDIENAVYRAAWVLLENLPAQSTVAVLSVASADSELAEFVIEELAFIIVDTKRFKVVDRRSLDAVQKEAKFQYSGDVDDNSAVSIGKLLGANVVITGSVGGSGATRRLRAKALNVQTAEILAMASERY